MTFIDFRFPCVDFEPSFLQDHEISNYEETYHILKRPYYIIVLREPAARNPETTSSTYNQTTSSPPDSFSICCDTWYIMHTNDWMAPRRKILPSLDHSARNAFLKPAQLRSHRNLGIWNGIAHEIMSNQTIISRNTIRATWTGKSHGIILIRFSRIAPTCRTRFAKQRAWETGSYYPFIINEAARIHGIFKAGNAIWQSLHIVRV